VYRSARSRRLTAIVRPQVFDNGLDIRKSSQSSSGRKSLQSRGKDVYGMGARMTYGQRVRRDTVLKQRDAQ